MLIVFAISLTTYAQDTVRIGAKFHITPGTVVSVMNSQTTVDDTLNNFGNVILNGSMTMENAGRIFNQDTIMVGANWINTTNGRYQEGPVYQGTVIFNSATAQTINQGGNNGRFFHLVFAGGGDKTLNGIVLVDSSVRFLNGIVNTAPADTFALLGGDVIGGTAFSHVNGMFYQEGSGIMRYPVGNGTAYRQAVLDNVPVSGTLPILGFEFLDGGHGGTPGSDLEDLVVNPYWRAYLRSGIFLGSKVSLRSLGVDGIADYSTAMIAQSNTPSGEYNSLGNSNVAGATMVTSMFESNGASIAGTSRYFALGRSANMNTQAAALLQGDMDGLTQMHDSLYALGELDQYLNGNANPLGMNMLPGYALPTIGALGPVDYVSVYLRTTATGTNLDTAYAWLMTDGTIRDFHSGTRTYATFKNYNVLVPEEEYFVVVNHRNHLPVMYSIADTVNQDTSGLVNFDVTKIANIYGAGAYQPDLTGNNVQMYTGNADATKYYYSNYIVDADDYDKVRVLNNSMPTGYLEADVNMDGAVNAMDLTITKQGVDMLYYSTVPF